MTRPLTPIYLQVTVALFHGSVIFALYLGTQMVYEQTSFKVCLRMTRPLTLK